MTAPFDWTGLWDDAFTQWRRIVGRQASQAAADYLRTRIEAAFVRRADYDKLGMGALASISDSGKKLGQATARAEAAEAKCRELAEALEFYANGIGHTELEDGGNIARKALGGEHG